MLQYLKTYGIIIQKDKPFRISLGRNIIFLAGRLIAQPFMRRSRRLILISLTEHMGDIVAAEPVSRHIRKEFPHAKIYWVVNHRFAELVDHNPYLSGTLTVTCIAEWIFLKRLAAPVVSVYDLHLNGRSCSRYKLTNRNIARKGITIFNYLDHGNLLKVFAASGGIENLPDDTPQFHFSNSKQDQVSLPFEYIVIHPLANDPDRNWSNEQWNILVDQVLANYPHLHIVEIGLRSIISNGSPRFHNATLKYTLQQIAHIIKQSTLFVGVESGFGHFANALAGDSIILIGYYQHYKNYQVYSGRFAAGMAVSLYYHPGKLCEANAAEVWPTVQAKLDMRHNRKLMRG